MEIWELILIAIGLSMDAFAVSVCKGLSMKKINYTYTAIIALFFGVFQALMTFVGWLLGSQFESYIVDFDHWIAFVLLGIIGVKMILESFKKNDNECEEADIKIKELFVLSIATSIDALAIGITFSFLNTNIALSTILIGGITLFLCAIGVILGNKFGAKHKGKAELAGGVVLILIGLKILLEHIL